MQSRVWMQHAQRRFDPLVRLLQHLRNTPSSPTFWQQYKARAWHAVIIYEPHFSSLDPHLVDQTVLAVGEYDQRG